MRFCYCGQLADESYQFDIELVQSVIANMKLGKAAGLDGVTAEHLQYSDASLFVMLSKLFNRIFRNSGVPASCGQSYTVPLLIDNNSVYNKSIIVNDFRGISISPAISKVLEHCILDRYANFLHY